MCQLLTNITLKLNPVRDVARSKRVVGPEDDILPEGFNTMIEVSCGQEYISSHLCVLAFLDVVLQVILPLHFDSFPIISPCLDRHALLAIDINVVVDLGSHLLQFRSEVAAPPHVARCEGEEELEGVESYLNDENFD